MHVNCRSPVFNAMFIHNTMESQRKEIKIEDLDIETVQDMLKYMYAGKIENLDTRSPRLLEAADKNQLSELKEICEVRNLSGETTQFLISSYREVSTSNIPGVQEVLCETLTVDSCLECLVLADLHTALDLKDAAVKFVVSHSTEFVDQVNLWIIL